MSYGHYPNVTQMEVKTPTPKIVLTQMEISPFCDKVRRVLHVKGLDYEAKNIGVLQLSFLKRHASTGKVPILDYGTQRILDSTDICLFLESRHPQKPLIPRDATQEAEVLLLEDWADESLYFFEMTMRFAWPDDRIRWSREIAQPDAAPVRALAPLMVPRLIRKITGFQGLGRKSREHLLHDLERLLGALDTRIGTRGFCVGDSLTLADISVAAQVHCIQGSGEGARVVESFAHLRDWKHRVDAMTLPVVRSRTA